MMITTLSSPGPMTTAIFRAVFTLLATEALVESGHAARVTAARVSPPGPGPRRGAQRIGTAVVDAHNDARAIVCTPSR